MATPDEQFERRHFTQLLGPHLPAGTYDESIYFLPGAFRYLLTHDADALDLITPIIGFISQNKKHLIEDGLWDTVRDCIRECLAYWTSKFQVIHYDKQACRAKGWGISYADLVKNSEFITMAVSDLVQFGTNADLAEEFIRDLALAISNPVKSAWFLELSCSQYRPAYYLPDYGTILDLINDAELLLKAAVLVEEQVIPDEPSPTYWNDTFEMLGLA